VLGRAGEEGQRLRLEAAKNGVITWRTPTTLTNLLFGDKHEWEKDSASRSSAKTVNRDESQVPQTKGSLRSRDNLRDEGPHDL
jgi:hypothetical protein